ncbi:MAG: hypothetical protein CMI31_04580 [Opitutae bacterium]|nr:hypothetical protein [Opitutae bacterium]|tara:strand:- start:897 stop:2924 length:2028 start_codon:yes stop_codon:yes gene_type:complete
MKHITITLMISASLVFAQEEKAKEEIKELDPIVVESSPLEPSIKKVTQAWSVLDGKKIDQARTATLGGTLANEPGISQSFFGPSTSRPIIRGLDKQRIRMLQNGTDSFDVSASSEDHAVPIDPLLVDRIEILRGSSALLYGGNAIGGVVNVIDRGIPTQAYSGFSGGSLLSSYSNVNKGWSAGANAYGGSDSLSFQINGMEKEYWEYDSPNGKIKNSMGDRSLLGFGASHIMKNGYAGLGYSQYDSTYHIPGGEHAENKSRIEMESDRFEFRSQIEIADSDWLKSIELNFAHGDYQHSEIGMEEGALPFETHSTYLREGTEGRIVLLHEVGEFSGALGFHGILDDFKITGEESIFAGASATNSAISSEESTRLAVFLVEQFELNENTQVNGGVRLENLDRDFVGVADRDDTAFSASAGIYHDLSDVWSLGGNLNYSERMPDAAELYSDGAHHATEAFEIGNSSLDDESAVGFELILRRSTEKVSAQVVGFHTRYSDYIYLSDTGGERDGDGNKPPAAGEEALTERLYKGVSAKFYGIEAEVDWLAMENADWSLVLSAQGDLVRARNTTDNANLPRTPPVTLGLGFDILGDKLNFGMNLTRAMKQDDLAPNETYTAGYSLLDAYASYDVALGDAEGELFLRGHNLTDEKALLHTSFRKSEAPLPGAGVEVGFRIDF